MIPAKNRSGICQAGESKGENCMKSKSTILALTVMLGVLTLVAGCPHHHHPRPHRHHVPRPPRPPLPFDSMTQMERQSEMIRVSQASGELNETPRASE